LVTIGEGEIFRLVSLLALRIERPDGRVLAQVGKWNGRKASGKCQLPGAKQLRDELTSESLDRLFRTKLAILRNKVDIVDATHETTVQMSGDVAIMTRYLRTICSARLKDAHELELQVFSASRPRKSRVEKAFAIHTKVEAFLHMEVLALWDEDIEYEATLLAWLLPQELGFLSSPAGTSVLDEWLSLIAPPAGAHTRPGSERTQMQDEADSPKSQSQTDPSQWEAQHASV